MQRLRIFNTPSNSEKSWKSDDGTIDLDLGSDLDLPPPKLLLKKKNKKKELRRRLRTPPPPHHYPPPPLPPRAPRPPHSLLTPLTLAALSTHKPPPILCCEHAKALYASTLSLDLRHISSETITPLLNNFLAISRETAYGRILDTTAIVEPGSRFIIAIQRVETKGRDMGKPRYFVPVVWPGAVGLGPGHPDGSGSCTHPKGNANGNETDVDMSGTCIAPKSSVSTDVKHSTAVTEHQLTRSLMDIESSLDQERRREPRSKRSLIPRFRRTGFLPEDPEELKRLSTRVEWEEGQLGFREWFFVAGDELGEAGKRTDASEVKSSGVGEETSGDGERGERGLAVMNNWLHVEGWEGRMDVKCWECDTDWVITVKERGMTI